MNVSEQQPVWPPTPERDQIEARVRAIPFRRKALYVLAVWAIVFLVAEVGARVGGYLIYGRSPFFLLYGIKSFMADSDPDGHSAAYEGYFNRDQGTYPAQLERLLNDSTLVAAGRRFEVINGGIPHANSDNISAMVEQEILTYRPDILTLYAGFNDAGTLMAPSALHRTLTWVHAHFASYVAFKRVVTALGGPELPSRWSLQAAGSDSSDLNEQIRLQTRRFRTNVERIASAAEQGSARLVLIRQAVTTGWGDRTGLSYQEKVNRARQVLATGGRVSSNEATLVVHSSLMQVLDSIASEPGLAIVDNISIVDRKPEYFASYVHLTESGNLALAEALRSVIHPTTHAGQP